MEFNLLTISWYGWRGFSILSFETENDIRCLLCIDFQNNRLILNFLFFMKIMFSDKIKFTIS